jgi:photosystem II stability/assembly factor-like uncharacterized protein
MILDALFTFLLWSGVFTNLGANPSVTSISQNSTCQDSSGSAVVNAILVLPNGDVASISYGVFISTNSGELWRRVGTPDWPSVPSCLAIDTGGQLFAGGYGFFRRDASKGVWHRIGTAFTDDPLTAIAVNKLNHFIVGTGNGNMYRSTNSGLSWSRLPIQYYGYKQIFIRPDGAIFVDASRYQFSTDEGNSWKLVSCPDSTVFATAVDSTGVMYLGIWGSIFMSHDGGHSWDCAFRTETPPSLITSIVVHKSSKIFAGFDSGHILVSADTGRSWHSTSFDSPGSAPVLCLATGKRGYIFVGTDGPGAFRSTDSGKTWKQINSGFEFPED